MRLCECVGVSMPEASRAFEASKVGSGGSGRLALRRCTRPGTTYSKFM